MIRTLAVWLLRLYPRTWRMRYEEEVRLFLEDHRPGLRDVAGLVHTGLTEWLHSFADPVAHPGTAGVLRLFFGWLGAVYAIRLAGVVGGATLRGIAGDSPAWAGFVPVAVMLVLTLRCLLTAVTWRREDVPFRPLTTTESRVWWTVLCLSVVLAEWDNDSMWSWSMGQGWEIGVVVLLTTSQRNWRRMKARTAWMLAREEHRDRVRGYVRVSQLLTKGLATREELDDIGRDVARLAANLERAAADYRAAGLRRLPPHHPLGLN